MKNGDFVRLGEAIRKAKTKVVMHLDNQVSILMNSQNVL